MKNVTLLFLLLSSYSLLSQDILMQNGTVSQCSGNFYDSGGTTGNYGDNQNFILTLCPKDPGQFAQLDFTAFNIQPSDVLSIYDGDSPNSTNLIGRFSGGSSNSPGFVRATSTNPTGCLTLEFISDESGTNLGWAATISCFTPCQTITSQIDSASPSPNGDGYIRVCPNELITLSGSGIFSRDGAGATYEWDLGDGNTITGQEATFSYSLPGVYSVNLNILDTNISSSNPLGCRNRNLINQIIHVATIPDFTGTKASESVLCYEESTTTIEGVVNPIEFIKDCTPPESGVTFLPDGNVGESYETAIVVDCYDSTQTLSDINQLVNICITIEHSYLDDLFIDIISPNGQTVRLHNRGGVSANLGIPWADGAVDLSANVEPGVGYEYCFVPGNTNPTLVGGILNGGVFPNGNGPNTYVDDYVPAGNFSSVSPLTGLLGSPLNGEWRIRITDNQELDNGFIFAWSIEFDPSLQSPGLSFSPTITSENWDSDPTITNITGNTITVNPLSAGTYCYNYRVVDDFDCEYVKQVCIEKLPELITSSPDDLLICNATVSPYNFDLTQNTSVIMEPAHVPSDLVVTYHESQIDANNGTNAIGTPDAYSGMDGQIIYVRIEYLNSGCYKTSTFTLNISFRPIINNLPDMMMCDDISNDGFASFDLSAQTPIILTGVTGTILTYHLSQADADMNVSPVSGSVVNTTNPQMIFVRLQDDNNPRCFTTLDFNLIVNPLPTIVPITLGECDVNGTGSTEFTLTDATSMVLDNQMGITVTYYRELSEANSGTFPLSANYTNTSNPQTVYVRLEDDITGCYNTTTLQLMVNPKPILNTNPSNLVLCDDINTGDLQEVFDLTNNTTYIINGNSGVTPTYHASFEDAENGLNAIVDPTMNTNNDVSQTIYVRVTNDLTGCNSIVDFDIIVNPLPAVVPVSNYILCEVNTDGFAQFNLASRNVEVLNGQNPAIYSVTYHTSRNDADNLNGALASSYRNTSNPQPIYVAITNILTGCSISTQSFNLEVDNGAEANAPSLPYTICDNIGDNDGRGQFKLTTQDQFILGLQDSTNFTVTYYATQGDAELGVNPIPYTYENISNPQVIYARVDNDTPDIAGMDSSICYAVSQLTLKVNRLPIFSLYDSYTLCRDTNGTEVIDPPFLNTGLPANLYAFMWSLEGTVLSGETGNSLTASQVGIYSVLVTNSATGCTNSDSTEVVLSSPPTVVVEVVTRAFSENHVITAFASGDGDYEYSLDGGPWQEDSTFTDVSIGEHTVTARDINGCGESDGTVTVLDYPHFFTPNGDGRNETWNIVGFANQSSTKIYIFDRFGKLLKQISPSGRGWNGTYNGNPMPSSDYWFTVEYNEPSTGEQRQFRSHFTLKR